MAPVALFTQFECCCRFFELCRDSLSKFTSHNFHSPAYSFTHKHTHTNCGRQATWFRITYGWQVQFTVRTKWVSCRRFAFFVVTLVLLFNAFFLFAFLLVNRDSSERRAAFLLFAIMIVDISQVKAIWLGLHNSLIDAFTCLVLIDLLIANDSPIRRRIIRCETSNCRSIYWLVRRHSFNFTSSFDPLSGSSSWYTISAHFHSQDLIIDSLLYCFFFTISFFQIYHEINLSINRFVSITFYQF